jgi:hypothetical protein
MRNNHLVSGVLAILDNAYQWSAVCIDTSPLECIYRYSCHSEDLAFSMNRRMTIPLVPAPGLAIQRRNGYFEGHYQFLDEESTAI